LKRHEKKKKKLRKRGYTVKKIQRGKKTKHTKKGFPHAKGAMEELPGFEARKNEKRKGKKKKLKPKKKAQKKNDSEREGCARAKPRSGQGRCLRKRQEKKKGPKKT